MPPSAMHPFVAVTDLAWYDFLSRQESDRRLDEVNFWSPRALSPLKHLRPGEPVFFRLKDPRNVVAGYGLFAHFIVVDLRSAWDMFGDRNGSATESDFLRGIARLRGVSVDQVFRAGEQLGCTILREARFWPESQWIPWGSNMGWARNIVRGATEDDPERSRLLLSTIEEQARKDLVLGEFADEFFVPAIDNRTRLMTETVRRVGQGSFKARLLDAYERRCAITGERTEPVLDAAHITPYLGTASNHVQNGLILTKEFHALFDQGLVGVTPDRIIRVSPVIRDRWSNGRRYYEYEGRSLRQPMNPAEAASPRALAWHLENVYISE